MELLDRLKAGRDALGSVQLNGVTLGLRILVEKDYHAANFAAVEYFDKNEVDLTLATADTFEAEKTVQLLALAVVDPETRKPVFSSVDEVREVLMRHDKDHLAEQYLEFERKFSPSGRNLTEEEFVSLLEEVKKNPETPRLSDLSGAWLRRLAATLAGQLQSLQRENGSSS
jgi:hypothetical protein